MMKYRIDVLAYLKEIGYPQHRLLKEKLFSGSELHKFRHKKMIGIHSLETLCEITGKQPNYFIVYVSKNAK